MPLHAGTMSGTMSGTMYPWSWSWSWSWPWSAGQAYLRPLLTDQHLQGVLPELPTTKVFSRFDVIFYNS